MPRVPAQNLTFATGTCKNTPRMTRQEKQQTIDRLHASGCSCIICNNGRTQAYHARGVADLYRLLVNRPQELDGAFVADKVVGKGAAAIMILGGVQEVYAALISTPALALLHANGVTVAYGHQVPAIKNRAGNGPCPVEELCQPYATAAQCLVQIQAFMQNNNPNP